MKMFCKLTNLNRRSSCLRRKALLGRRLTSEAGDEAFESYIPLVSHLSIMSRLLARSWRLSLNLNRSESELRDGAFHLSSWKAFNLLYICSIVFGAAT